VQQCIDHYQKTMEANVPDRLVNRPSSLTTTSDSMGDTSLSSPAPSIVLTDVSNLTNNKKKKYAEQDKKKREEQRKQGMSLSEDDMVVQDGSIVSISGIPISNITLEALKAFARKLRLKVPMLQSLACAQNWRTTSNWSHRGI
jgi:hypothetical protein